MMIIRVAGVAVAEIGPSRAGRRAKMPGILSYHLTPIITSISTQGILSSISNSINSFKSPFLKDILSLSFTSLPTNQR